MSVNKAFNMMDSVVLKPQSWQSTVKDDWSLLRGSNLVFVKRDMGQTNNQHQRHFNAWPISELRWERYIDSIQTSLKLYFCNQAIMECHLCFSAQPSRSFRLISHCKTSDLNFTMHKGGTAVSCIRRKRKKETKWDDSTVSFSHGDL
jgi:hypothetical protein